MRGTMVWFNEAKGLGVIQTEDDEQLRVSADGFREGHVPVGRCSGRPVSFVRAGTGAEAHAVEVELVEDENPRRARRRQATRSSI